jgi:uncharacterized protein (TIGR02594 family)
MASNKTLGDKASRGEVEKATTSTPTFLIDVPEMKFSWLSIAESQLGVTEKPGSANNEAIVDYHATTTLKATEDSVPWCSSFVNWCMEQAGYKGTKSARALSWKNWGVAAESFIPNGSLVVMKRKGGGHVGFKVGEDQFYVYVLGGNQSDSVNVAKFAHSQVLGYRLPESLNDDDDVTWEYLFSHGH